MNVLNKKIYIRSTSYIFPNQKYKRIADMNKLYEIWLGRFINVFLGDELWEIRQIL